MTKETQTKTVREGDYIAEVEIELVYTEKGWSPYLSLEDAQKLDEIREALRQEDLRTASQMARIFKLNPVDITSN